jgi:acetyl esterase/lipase
MKISNLYQTIIHAWLAIIVVFSDFAHAENTLSSIDPDGTIHVRELIIPPSRLWTPALRQYMLSRMVESQPPMPARDAPRSEWDKYTDQVDRTLYAPLLTRAKQLYPVTVVETKVAGVRVAIVTPKDEIAAENRQRILINLRGGGFVVNHGFSFGLLDSIPVAAIGRIKVITVDYRQAPFYVYPAATEDVEAVYRELLKHHKPEQIGLYGCSAGGALAAQAVAWFHARSLPRPGAIGVLCTAPSPSWAPSGGDSDIWRGRVPESPNLGIETPPVGAETWYMAGASLGDPNAYPDTSDLVLARFPPTLLLTGTRAFEMSATVVAHARLLKLGVDASLYVMEGAGHADHVYAVSTPEAHDAYTYIARWFSRHLTQ